MSNRNGQDEAGFTPALSLDEAYSLVGSPLQQSHPFTPYSEAGRIRPQITDAEASRMGSPPARQYNSLGDPLNVSSTSSPECLFNDISTDLLYHFSSLNDPNYDSGYLPDYNALAHDFLNCSICTGPCNSTWNCHQEELRVGYISVQQSSILHNMPQSPKATQDSIMRDIDSPCIPSEHHDDGNPPGNNYPSNGIYGEPDEWFRSRNISETPNLSSAPSTPTRSSTLDSSTSVDSTSTHLTSTSVDSAYSATYNELQGTATLFQCTLPDCNLVFDKKCDWIRHELGSHKFCPTVWICMCDQYINAAGRCVFCSKQVTDPDHHRIHNTKRCIARYRNKSPWRFQRVDGLKQHVIHNHMENVDENAISNYWEILKDWCVEKEKNKIVPQSLWCGFCEQKFETNAERMKDVAQHFRDGRIKADWKHLD